ncbi:MAG: hypothetical protein P8X68_04555, partial [Desulfobacterales bacterium]
ICSPGWFEIAAAALEVSGFSVQVRAPASWQPLYLFNLFNSFNWFGLSQPIQPIRPIKPIKPIKQVLEP